LIVDAAPPHAEGAVDVGIRYNGHELRSKALLITTIRRMSPSRRSSSRCFCRSSTAASEPSAPRGSPRPP
jgi:hypothetical protein